VSNLALAPAAYPFTTFNFGVEIRVNDDLPRVCNAAFAECDGLEMTMDVKTIREGGNNATQIRLAGPVGYGQLTLRRGMTSTFDLWDWFSAVTRAPDLRADGEVVLYAADGVTERVRFVLSRLLPIRVKAPQLNAKDGLVAIEELQVAYESLTLKPAGAAGGIGVGASAGVGVGGGAGISASAGVSVGGGVSASAGVSAGGVLGV
jgi:phage tail-like protein